MLCCSEQCDRKNQCAIFYRNPQPEYRKYDNVEPLATHGWGSISIHGCESHYDCGHLENIRCSIQFQMMELQMILIRWVGVHSLQICRTV